MTSKFFLLLTLAVASAVADPRVELGTLQGAGFRIDVQETWNGSLVLRCHGYAMTMPDFSKETAARGGEVFTRLGYAVAQSAYASEGWAVQDALKDTEALRGYFNDKYGKPKETFLAGLSMGGQIVALLSETNPNLYAGTLALCPAVAPPYDIFGARFHPLVA